VPNRSEVLKALEWVDLTAREGDVERLAKAKRALEQELAAGKGAISPDRSYSIALESFVRKHGREPMEDLPVED
jgi:hypothetical protein